MAPTLVAARAALPPERAVAALGRPSGANGFTLLELLVVVAIMAIATAGVSLSLRDSSQTQLEREALRLTALLESARAQSRMSANTVRWRATPGGFRLDGVSATEAPTPWLGDDVTTDPAAVLVLGPEPIIGPQRIRLVSRSDPSRSLTIATDGVGPFAVQTTP